MKGLAILLCSLLVVLVASQDTREIGFGALQNDSIDFNSSSFSSEQSQCQICADGGDCSEAYNGEPGRYCNDWIDKQGNTRPCCCPTDAVCKPSTDECLCSSSGKHSTKSKHDSDFGKFKGNQDFDGVSYETTGLNTDEDDEYHSSAGESNTVTYVVVIMSALVIFAALWICMKSHRGESGSSSHGHSNNRGGGSTGAAYGGNGGGVPDFVSNNPGGGGGGVTGCGGGNPGGGGGSSGGGGGNCGGNP